MTPADKTALSEALWVWRAVCKLRYGKGGVSWWHNHVVDALTMEVTPNGRVVLSYGSTVYYR